MNAAFLEQWQLYRRGMLQPPLVGLASETESAFDSDAREGEIRIFADTNRPLVALLVADCALSGWRIVPVSPFCAPASGREIMVGARVLQLWNATVVSRRLVSRSWRVDAISAEELLRVRGSLAAARPGRLTAGDGVQARYEREFLLAEGALVPLVPPAADRVAWWRPAMLLAASFAVLLAAWQVFLRDDGRRLVRRWRVDAPAVRIAQESGEIDLLEAGDEPESPVEIADTPIEVDLPVATWRGREMPPEVIRPPQFADVKGPRMPETLAKSPARGGVRLRAAADAPLRVLFLASAPREGEEGERMLAHARAEGYAASRAPLEKPPRISCTLADGTGADALLTIAGEAVDGAKVTVLFDPADVKEYVEQVVRATGTVLATYELTAVDGRKIGPEAVRVTLIWPSAEGDENTPLAVGR